MKKRKILINIAIIIIIVVLVVAAFYFLVKKKVIRVNPLLISSERVIGADISRYQGYVDMDLLADQGLQFVYIKATEGVSHIDTKYLANREKALNSRLAYGAYHFFSFDSDGKKQAEHFIRIAGDLKDAMIPVVDVEYYGDKKEKDPPDKQELTEQLHACLDTLEAEYGVKPMIYTSKDIYNEYLKGEFDDYPKWIRSIFIPAELDGWKDWTMWQYTDTAKLEGYTESEYIDLDVLNRNVELDQLMIR